MQTRWIPAAAAVLCALVLATPAAAQEKPDYEAAKRHYAAAEAAVAAGEWEKAAAEYGTAYEITRDPVLFFKLGDAYQNLGDCARASDYYRRYLEEAKPSEAFVADTEARLEACEAQGGGPVDVAEEPDAAPEVEPEAEPTPAADPAVAPPTAGEPALGPTGPSFLGEEPTWQRTAAWSSVGAAVAFATAGAVFGLSASSREEDIENLFAFRDPAGRPATFDGNTRARYEDLQDEGERFETLSLVAFGAAGVATTAAVLFFLLDPGPADDAAAVTVSPSAGEGAYGVTAGWRF